MNEKISILNKPNEKIDILNEKISNLDIVYRGYLGFPRYSYSGVRLDIDAIYVTNRGVLAVVDNFDGEKNSDFVYNKLNGVLMGNSYLMSGRRLKIDLDVYELNSINNPNEFKFNDIDVLLKYYLEKKDKYNSEKLIRHVINSLEGCLKKEGKIRKNSNITDNLMKIEQNISIYDNSQLKCLEDYDSKVQVISGLAGSGKTVILCKKIAELLLSDDRIKLCITFQSRSLKEEIKSMVFDFLKISTDIPEILMDRLDIINAWGDQNGDGFYSNLCKKLKIVPMSLYIAKKYNYNDPFSFVCKELYDYIISNNISNCELYDYILIDEAQDLNEYFLKLAFKCLTRDGKLVYAYDEFQDLNSKLMKPPHKIFGEDIKYTSTPLKICYRTPREILVTAHSIGMGINSDEGICQFFESQSVWESIGYNLKLNNNQAICERDNSPIFEDLEKHDLISLKEYDNIEQLEENLVKLVDNDLKDGLLADDIMIVDLEKWETLNDFNIFKSKADNIFDTSFAGINNPNRFFEKDKIMYSYVHRAKGNEAYKVYIVNAQLSMNSLLRDVWRNRLFTAMTRSKYEVVLLCVNDLMTAELCEKLKNEIEIVKNNDYKLKFEYPSSKDIEKIKLISEANLKTESTLEKTANDFDNLKKNNENAIDHISELLKGKFNEDEIKKLVRKLAEENEK